MPYNNGPGRRVGKKRKGKTGAYNRTCGHEAMMGLRRWVTGERDSEPELPEKKGPEGVIGEGREEEEGKDWNIQQNRCT